MEFQDLRTYIPGDPVKHIDRKTSAKKQDIYIKQFEDAKGLDVRILSDLQHKNIYKEKMDTAHQLIYMLGYAVLSNNDKLGYIYKNTIYNTKNNRFALRSLLSIYKKKPSRAKIYVDMIKKILGIGVHNTHKYTDTALRKLLSLKIKKSLVIYISTTNVLPLDVLLQISRNNEILIIDLYIPEELTLNTQDRYISFNNSREIVNTQGKKNEYLHLVSKKLKSNTRHIQSLGGRYIALNTGSDIVHELILGLKQTF